MLKQKLHFYLDKLIIPTPDSVIAAVDWLIQESIRSKNQKMFRYFAAELLNKYATSKIICMDAVYVFIGEKYYCTGRADWVDSVQLEKICANVREIKPTCCGTYAPNITLKKLDGTPVQLYELNNRFTAIYFWDPSCGNCSKTSTKLVPVYHKYKKYGFEVFGICSKT